MLDNVISKVKNMMNNYEDGEKDNVSKDTIREIRETKAANQYRHIQEHTNLRYNRRMQNNVYSELNKDRMYRLALANSLPKSIKKITSAHN
ncbi:hypothetical protein [Apilactobacillus micheneri]|uniref:Uncharacterized protein n=1 Tax=Apilactobacillus micheneri TaxID=1899430 RepID=A0A2S2JLV5_9LACO|nr:hypothetical protein [Apilactobacillus micheneri]TPR26355.1 hypothetical protein DY114_01275 [Apilactobacillus micheneri]TPR27109.1 hypothetical protein DY111_01275 [Apilactobacillus micheneri]TPR27357.1 hypothetical protein DY113_06225 [Apilactobacillus micheneri]TPR31872.1 hypothetical protein DY117_01275 [Apilactobacillus micheneri]TPR32276.1 hypothetical protein DY120_01275 [Apilactobacillus micheneri]